MLPAYQMKELFDLHPQQPWSIVYFQGAPRACWLSSTPLCCGAVFWRPSQGTQAQPRRPSPCPADGRHLDAYDGCAAQYWPAVQQFVDGLEPADALPAEAPPSEPAAAGQAVELRGEAVKEE